ncbi:MAG: hypothetical protein N2049_03705 [Anaerolineales bacterium]|nr:hypothetical protein [Anaerolineales bacterium]MCX7608309.1 hypothetical protein [Anaerolineales bacterium]MDW8227338.1 Gmad2 immunoglobulin-like domain-containing protein [Anaerolineales bacterium]
MQRVLFALLVLVVGLGCSISGLVPTSVPEPSLPSVVTPIAPTSVPELTPEALRNAMYDVSEFFNAPTFVTLVDGHYSSGTDPTAEDYLQVSLGEVMAFGDLNYDGVNDAAAVLFLNTGGTGVFVYLAAVLNEDGLPLHVASVFLGDRSVVETLSIAAGEILVQAVVHGPEDPMCCPSQPLEMGYRLYESELVLSRLAEQTPGGLLRQINITFPADLVTLDSPFTLTGHVSIGPFENTLTYNIYGPDNTLLTTSWVMTDSPEPGAPGSFSLPLDLTTLGVHGRVRIEIVEYSMEDGSVLTLDSVLVNVP